MSCQCACVCVCVGLCVCVPRHILRMSWGMTLNYVLGYDVKLHPAVLHLLSSLFRSLGAV